jgi:hypothetical protein
MMLFLNLTSAFLRDLCVTLSFEPQPFLRDLCVTPFL